MIEGVEKVVLPPATKKQKKVHGSARAGQGVMSGQVSRPISFDIKAHESFTRICLLMSLILKQTSTSAAASPGKGKSPKQKKDRS